MKKKLIFILLAFIMLGVIAYFYVNRVLLPGQVKTALEKTMSDLTRRSVTIDKIQYRIAKGFSLSNIQLKEAADGQVFLHIDEIRLNLLLFPFLKDKTVIIPAITVKKPVIQIIRHEDGSFNLSDMFAQKGPGPSGDQYKTFITKLKIMDGKADYLQKKSDQDFSESFRNINVDLTLSATKQLTYRINAFLPLEQSNIAAEGQYTLGSRNISTQLTLAKIDLLKYLRQYPLLPEEIKFNDGELSSASVTVRRQNGNLEIFGEAYLSRADIQTPHGHLTGNIRWVDSAFHLDGPNVTAAGELRIPSVKLNLTSGQSFEGDIQAFFHAITYNHDQRLLDVNGDFKADNMSLHLNKALRFNGNLAAKDILMTSKGEQLSMAGEFDLSQALLFLSDDQQYAGNVSAKNFSLSSDKGRLTVKTALKSDKNHFIIGPNELLNSDIVMEELLVEQNPDAVRIKSDLSWTDTVISLQRGAKFEGSGGLDIQYLYDYKKPERSTLDGSLTVDSGLLIGLPYIETASNITGTMSIAGNRFHAESIAFNAENTNLTLSGDLDNLATMNFDVALSTDSIELKRVMTYFPEFFEKNKMVIDGRSAVTLSFKGSPERIDGIGVAADIKTGTVTLDKLSHPITDITGSINYADDRLSWSQLKGAYQNFPFTVTGNLANFSKPQITTSLQTTNLEAASEIQLYSNTIRFPVLKAKYLNSEFTGSADVYLFEDTAPDIQVTGQAAVSCGDLPGLFPSHKEFIDPWGFDGRVDTNIFFKGKLKPWEDWSLTIDGKSPALTIKKHPLKDVKITYLQRDKNISKLDLTGEVYQGKVNFNSSANIENKKFPFKLNVGLFGIDLAEFAQTQKIKNDKLAGKGTLNLDVEGELFAPSSWKGKGNYDIADGYLWQMNIIQGLANVFLIKEFTHTVYTTSRADFKISDRKILTENLYLESQTMKLNAKGWVDFDDNVDFDVSPALSEIALIQSESIKKITSAILAQNITFVKITGTLDEPKIDPKTSPIEILKNTTGVITEGIGGIVDGILKP